MVDSKEKRTLSSHRDKKHMDRKEKAQVKDISKKIKQRESETTKEQKDVSRYRTFLRSSKDSNRSQMSRPERKILITHMRNEVGDIEASRKGIANTFCNMSRRSYSTGNNERTCEEDSDGRLEKNCCQSDDDENIEDGERDITNQNPP